MDAVHRKEFGRRVAAVLQRAFSQLGLPAPRPPEEACVIETLWKIGGEGGWALRDSTGELDGASVHQWVERLVAALPQRPEFPSMAKQLVKACFQAGPADCRDSYQECSSNGRCRRQELDYAKARISGAHCVDCPYWNSLQPEGHAAWLAAHWHAGSGAFHHDQVVFLPEDFRALRAWRPTRDETCACG